MDFELAKEFVGNHIEKMPAPVKDFYSNILKDIDNLQNDNPINVNEVLSLNVVRFLINDLMTGQFTDERLQFYEAMSFIVYNWNNNTIKNIDIDLYCQIIKKLIYMFVLLLNGKNNMKSAMQTLNTYRGWFPASHDIALTYLDELFKKHERFNDDLLEQNTNEGC